MNLPKAILRRRKSLNLNQTQLKDLADIGHNQITRLELGQTTPTIPMLIKLCKVFKCKLSELIKEAEELN